MLRLQHVIVVPRLSRAFLLAILALASPSLAAIKDPVRVEQGLLAGAEGRSSDIRVYRGIPFAAPPVGDLRWKPPQLAAPWQGVRQATQFGKACFQPPYPSNRLYGDSPPPIGEDCLYLNIGRRRNRQTIVSPS
jgi:para-nitrobenzyl esterase